MSEGGKSRVPRGNLAGGRRPVPFDETARMGFLVHELRNALACVFVAYGLIDKAADAGANALMKRNLLHMRGVLDRAYTEIHFAAGPRTRSRRSAPTHNRPPRGGRRWFA